MRTREICRCGRTATREIEESTLLDDLLSDQHPPTGYICGACFVQFLGCATVPSGVDWRVCMYCHYGYE